MAQGEQETKTITATSNLPASAKRCLHCGQPTLTAHQTVHACMAALGVRGAMATVKQERDLARAKLQEALAGARELLDELCSLQADHEVEPRSGDRVGYAGFKARWEALYPWLREVPS